MRKIFTIFFALSLVTYYNSQTEDSIRSKLNNYLKEINFAQNHFIKNLPIPPRQYNFEDYRKLIDPENGGLPIQKLVSVLGEIKTGKFLPKKNISLLNHKNSISSRNINSSSVWVERGPYDVGGRTRAILYDPNDPTGKRVFAGGVSGGLFVNDDITNAKSEWKPIGDLWENTSIVCIAADPNNSKVMYVGTGESCTGDNVGSGIWKTSDGGNTWSQIFKIPVSYNGSFVRNGNFYINDIKVRNNNGTSEIYVGVSGGYNIAIIHGMYQAGLYKSTDNGNTFTRFEGNLLVSTNPKTGFDIQQIEIGADNSVWVTTRMSPYGEMTPSGGRIFRSTDGINFTKVYDANIQGSRVQIALSKQNPAVAYALLEANVYDMYGTLTSNEPVRIIKSNDTGSTWSSSNVANSNVALPVDADKGIPANDFTRGQSFYDLVIATDPNNDKIVYVGGINLFKSTDAAASWTQISKWSNNPGLDKLSVSYVHADQHTIVFNPKNTNQFLVGNDGGVFIAEDKNNIMSSNSFSSRNNRYNVTQFYDGKLNPTKSISNEEILAGAQDRGTQKLYGSAGANNFYYSQDYYGGDGAFCDFDDQNLYTVFSYVNNNHFIKNLATNSTYQLITGSDTSLGFFINPAALDRNLDIFYSYKTKNTSTNEITLNSVSGLASNPMNLERKTISLGNILYADVAYITVSPFTKTSSIVFVGLTNGKIIRINNAESSTPQIVSLNTPFVGSISDIQFGPTYNDIVVTISNYNTVSVYYSSDEGKTWNSKEGNLPDFPVRTALMNPENTNEVIIGTEVGVWGTVNFQSASPTWSQYTSGIGTVKITNLDYRPSDKTVLATTYGRGVFTSSNTELSTSNVTKEQNLAKVYPNPSRGDIFVKYDDSKYKNPKITIFDASGKLVLTKLNVKSDERISLSLPKGVYILKMEDKINSVYTTPVIIR